MSAHSDTPETDALIQAHWGNGFAAKHLQEPMRNLERQRNEARELLASEKSTRNTIIAQGIETERQLAEAHEENARLREALKRIANLTDAPDIDPLGETQFGLHCGVEDRNCADRYEGADYGFTCGAERALEWAQNEAKHALTP